jgi:shikimate dehydrogenase
MTPLVFAVIGSPVAHSKSPIMHAAAYAALGLPHRYERLETSEAEVEERIAALRAGTYAGLNVTVPHKQRVLGLVDQIDESALGVGAANTIVRLDGGVLRAHNTDAPALAAEILRAAGGGAARLRGGSGIVIGSGGAARAAVLALARAGIARVVVRARAFDDPARGATFAKSFPGIDVVTSPLAAPASEADDLRAIVQATSCGMQGGAPGDRVADAVAWASVSKEAVAIDVVYVPRDTPFLRRARARGIACDDGLGMLARQGALAFALWLGTEPPFDVMLAALGRPPGET